MLPEILGAKSGVFTQRICAYNESFSPLEKKVGESIGFLWHQGIAGRNDEDVTSCFVKLLQLFTLRGVINLIVWLDNCTAQNKNWTLFSALVAVLNSLAGSLKSISLKYFEQGHTFMSADSFHHRIELRVRQKGDLCDFDDFVGCVAEAGSTIVMKDDDFLDWKNELSAGKQSKESKPRLDKVVEAFFKKGETKLFFKESHADAEYKSSEFLKRKFLAAIRSGTAWPSPTSYKGIKLDRKQGIISTLVPLMPQHHGQFWQDLKAYE